MATSGSFDYSVTAAEILTEAHEILGVLGAGESITTDESTSALRTLNMLAKGWQGNADFAPGLKLWNRKTGYVFLQASDGDYTLGGSSGDHATLAYDATTMRVAASTSATTLEVTSTTGFTAADYIGIELDSGAIYWTTVSSVTDGDTVVITAGLTSAAAAGNRIFCYTTKIPRPLVMEYVAIRNTNGEDMPLTLMSREYYEGIANKTETGSPSRFLYEDGIGSGTLYLDCAPDDVTDVLRIVFLTPAEDYGSSANDIAFPQQWHAPLSFGLAKRLAPKFQVSWTQTMQDGYQEALTIARAAYPQTCEAFFQPGAE